MIAENRHAAQEPGTKRNIGLRADLRFNANDLAAAAIERVDGIADDAGLCGIES